MRPTKGTECLRRASTRSEAVRLPRLPLLLRLGEGDVVFVIPGVLGGGYSISMYVRYVCENYHIVYDEYTHRIITTVIKAILDFLIAKTIRQAPPLYIAYGGGPMCYSESMTLLNHDVSRAADINTHEIQGGGL